MDTHTTDQEQIEAIKRWWAENGRSIVIGLLLGVAAVAGFRYWLHYQKQQSTQASDLFAVMQVAASKGETEKTLDTGAQLIAEYPRTPYSTLAAFAMAKARVEAGNLDAAAEHLQSALANAGDNGLRHIARLRLARVKLAQGQADAALALIVDVPPGGFTSEYEELKGDIYAAQNKPQEARSAYQIALLGVAQPRREFLQMKLDNLPPESPAAEPATEESKP